MEHQGVIFPPPYKPHGVRMRYAGEPVTLTPAQEEIATFYASACHPRPIPAALTPRSPLTSPAAVPKEGPHLGTARTAKVFNANFFKDFRSALGQDHVIQKFELCDFDVRAGERVGTAGAPRHRHAFHCPSLRHCCAAHPRLCRRGPGAQEGRDEGVEGGREGREGGTAAQVRLCARRWAP